VTGVDLSDTMIRRARRLVPRARFVRADMTEVVFPDREFGAVIALY
jgi:ubiquinone/menaquinone biosynthesis C-methylase UbiE